MEPALSAVTPTLKYPKMIWLLQQAVVDLVVDVALVDRDADVVVEYAPATVEVPLAELGGADGALERQVRLLHALARHQRPGDGHAAAARAAGLHFLGEVAEAQELVVNLDVGLDVAPERSPGLGLRMPANLYKFWHTIGMANPAVVQVHPLSEVRARLSGILARFRREGAAAEPVAFGSHRKPEAVLIPYEAYERYEALARQRARLDGALPAARSVQVELPGAFSPEHDREVPAYVDGEVSAAEPYRRTVSRYRRP
jgi:hypothetical protein